MNAWRLATSWGMAAIVAIIILWDGVLGYFKQDTESQIIAELAREWSIIPLATGIIAGHWFLNQSVPNYKLWPFGLIVVGVVLAADLVNIWIPIPHAFRYPGLYLIVGIFTGALLWSQGLPGNWVASR